MNKPFVSAAAFSRPINDRHGFYVQITFSSRTQDAAVRKLAASTAKKNGFKPQGEGKAGIPTNWGTHYTQAVWFYEAAK